MEIRIVEFVALLRRNGISVSISETIDALRALELVGVEEPPRFRDALRMTLVKRSPDHSSFERLFEIFFLGLSSSIRASEAEWTKEMDLAQGEFQKILELIGGILGEIDLEISPLAHALLSGNMGEVERLLCEAGRQEREKADPQAVAGVVCSGLALRLGTNGLRRDLEAFKFKVAETRPGGEALERLSRYADWRFQQLLRLLGDWMRQDFQRSPPAGVREAAEDLLEKSFMTYSEDDIHKMRQAVTRLAQRFKGLLSLRRKKGRRGRFDIKETLRKNLQYGGVPFKLRLERKREDKPQVVLLCDISDSVLNASRFMLHFVYSVQDLYKKVRSFVFVSDIGEITGLFDKHDLPTAVEKALKGDVVDVCAHSNFGRAFEVFYRTQLPAVTHKTTVIVIGDGRNNYHRPNEWALREIRGKAKRVIWLNPESRLTWGYGDSEMPRYLPYCNAVEECRNMRQLYQVMDRITT